MRPARILAPERRRQVPAFIYLMIIGAVAMLVPALHASLMDLNRVAQPFFYGAILLAILAGLLGLATAREAGAGRAREELLTLLGAFALLPVFLALPMREAVPSTSFFNAYFEMVSSMTTTGASIFGSPDRVPLPIHLWRALVGWLGGFLMLLSAAAILAPLNLGGYEVLRPRRARSEIARGAQTVPIETRLARHIRQILPVYLAATLLLWLVLLAMGVEAAEAFCIAFSTISTSGILPESTLANVVSGQATEIVIFVFFFLAVSRQVFLNDVNRHFVPRLAGDREMRIALILTLTVSLALFLRHWLGAFEVDEENNLALAFQSLWGALFTNMSFLTTTGFTSANWSLAERWSALPNTSLILAGFCIFGGGVATTAGGVKLLRIYALYQHGQREMARLIHPSSIGRAGGMGRELRRQGAVIAWVFFMLFAMSIALVAMALAFMGQSFEDALIFAVSALSTTGPLAPVALEQPAIYSDLSLAEKWVLICAMILGRLETLAIIALFNPDFWRS